MRPATWRHTVCWKEWAQFLCAKTDVANPSEGELPQNAKINETDNLGDEDPEDLGFEFDEDRDGEENDEDSAGKDVDIDDI